jgi:hypothetical protein
MPWLHNPDRFKHLIWIDRIGSVSSPVGALLFALSTRNILGYDATADMEADDLY